MGRKFEPCWDRHMKPESKLWQLVKKNITSIHWTRLESWAMPGVPDVYGIQDEISVFVELKVTKSNKIGLSPFQKNWLYNHYLHGGRSFIMLHHLGQRLLYIFPSSILHSPLSTLHSIPRHSAPDSTPLSTPLSTLRSPLPTFRGGVPACLPTSTLPC